MRRLSLMLLLALAACTSDVTVLEAGGNTRELAAMAKTAIATRGLYVNGMTIVGDLDGDGIEDLVVVEGPSQRLGGPFAGASVDVVYGARPFPAVRDIADAPRIIQDSPWPYGGIAIVAGDFDGDGLADFAVVHDCGQETTAGAYVLYGSRKRLSGTETFAASGAAHLVVPNACQTTAAATDLDGDGKADLALSARAVGPPSLPRVGSVYLLYGARWVDEVQVPAEADAVLTQGAVGVGSLMGAIGDVDGDGRQDLLIADNGTYGELYEKQTRKAYIVPGGATRLHGQLVASDLGTLVEGFIPQAGQGLIAKLGDLDGDGVDDFAVASAHEGELVSLFYGRRGGFGPHIFTTQADAHIAYRPASGDATLAAAGFIDASGHSGFVVGHPGRGDGRGAVYIFPGNRRYQGDVDVDTRSTVLVGDFVACDTVGAPACELPEMIGELVAVGDLDGDGQPDLVVAGQNFFDSNALAQIYVLDLAGSWVP